MEKETAVDSPTDGLKSELECELFIGSHIVVDKQWINWKLIFSVSDSALLVIISTVQDINIMRKMTLIPSRCTTAYRLSPSPIPPQSPASLRSAATLPGSVRVNLHTLQPLRRCSRSVPGLSSALAICDADIRDADSHGRDVLGACNTIRDEVVTGLAGRWACRYAR